MGVPGGPRSVPRGSQGRPRGSQGRAQASQGRPRASQGRARASHGRPGVTGACPGDPRDPVIQFRNLREFMLTTVIMTPGACRTQGRSAQKWTVSGSETSETSEGSNSGSIIWMHRNNGFSTLGRENDVRISYKFDFQGRIYLKLKSSFSNNIKILIIRAVFA
jgi:hypothetical protein